jgi:hypothetical protein
MFLMLASNFHWPLISICSAVTEPMQRAKATTSLFPIQQGKLKAEAGRKMTLAQAHTEKIVIQRKPGKSTHTDTHSTPLYLEHPTRPDQTSRRCSSSIFIFYIRLLPLHSFASQPLIDPSNLARSQE